MNLVATVLSKERTMKVIVCLDEKNGMLFNNRRQSQDRVVRGDMIDIASGSRLLVNEYTAGQFKDDADKICISKMPMEEALEADYCFIENLSLAECKENIKEIVVYRWDKKYPADTFMDIDLGEYQLAEEKELEGYSHEVINREIYKRP